MQGAQAEIVRAIERFRSRYAGEIDDLVEHVLGMLAAGDSLETIVSGYPWMAREDVLACLAYAKRLVGHERVEPFLVPAGTRHTCRGSTAVNHSFG